MYVLLAALQVITNVSSLGQSTVFKHRHANMLSISLGQTRTDPMNTQAQTKVTIFVLAARPLKRH